MDSTDTHAPSHTASQAPGNIQPCEIHVDEEGDWTHKGIRIIRDDIIEIFLENLQLAPDGSYLIRWDQSLCALDAADTVFVVGRADRVKSEDSMEEQVLLGLKHLSRAEPLDPATLWVGRDNVLYCRVREGRFPARFSRPAYYQLAEWIREDEATGGFYLELSGRRFSIRMDEAE